MSNVNGPWIVTTEGDVEGRTTTNLGIYSGPIDRIALGLAEKSYYCLEFKPLRIIPAEELPITKSSVYVHTYGLGADIHDLLKGRPVTVDKGNYYESVKLTASEAYQPEIMASLVKSARQKLSNEELAALRAVLADE